MNLFIATLVRSFLYVTVGALITRGIISKSQADAWILASEPVVEGLLIYIGTLVWSFLNAANFKKLLSRF